MAETVVYTPEQQANNLLPYALMNNNGFFGGNGGSAFWGALLGSVIPGFFGGWGGSGFGGFGGGNAAASLGAQATAYNNTDAILRAIDGTDSDVRLLASTLNTDVDSLKVGLSTIQGAIAQVGSQVGMSGLQVINAIQSGNSGLMAKLQECCCENRLAICQQTNQLGSQADRNTNSVINAINAQTIAMNDGFCQIKERELQTKIDELTASNTILRTQIDNANQTAAFAAMLAPINAKLVEIENRQPATVPVVYPNLVATPVTPTATANG